MTGWRTVLFGSLLAVVGVLQTADWATLIPAAYVGPVTAGIGFAVIWLRSMTKTPVGVK